MTVSTTRLTKLYASVVAGGATGYNCVNLLSDSGVTATGKTSDATVFGNTWDAKRSTLISASYTGSGFFDYYGDTTGQKYLMDNAIRGTETWFKHYYGSGTYYLKSRVELTNFGIKTTPAGMIEFNFTADSTGTISQATGSP